jgi:DNA-binding MarR family transcriptional regulator
MSDPLPFDPVHEAARNWAKHWGEEPVPSMRAVTSVMRVQQILLARLNDTLKPFDLTFPRYEALMLLYYSRRGALPLGKMGDRLQVHRTSVTNIIDGLERSGFVTREPHQRDRRTTLASITPKGRETAADATKLLNEMRFGTGPLERADLDAITLTLERLRADADGFPPER